VQKELAGMKVRLSPPRLS